MTFFRRVCLRSRWTSNHQFNPGISAAQRFYSSSHVRDGSSPLRVAVIGSGPAGFYSTKKLISEVDNVRIDMFERLPVPFGLVRFGVAPDHPEVKNCQDAFTEVAHDSRFRFFGNITIGDDLSLPSLAPNYDAILFAYGASKDRELGIEGENHPNVYSARAFVGWYNGLPEHRDLNPDLTNGEDAVIIGQGNVALDVARILLTNVDDLRKTDITTWAIDALAKSRIKRVRIVGRRGPGQAAFTIKELRELIQLPSTYFEPVDSSLFPPDSSTLPRPQKRLLQLLQKGSPSSADSPKSWQLDFLLSPEKISWSKSQPSKLTNISFVRNTLTEPFSPTSSLKPTESSSSHHTIPASVLFRSIGYKSEPLPGFTELGISFDKKKGVIRNDGLGRAYAESDDGDRATLLPGVYCTGWVKRGPTGVIASTMSDAFSTAEAIAADWKQGKPFLAASQPRQSGVQTNLNFQNKHPVSWSGWEAIDRVEKTKGMEQGRVRDKMGSISDMLAAASSDSELSSSQKSIVT